MKKCEITNFPQLDYATAEAMNTLCTNLTFCGSSVRRIMVTSCRASEGKSFVAMNIARKMAELGKNVVLVDADLRRSMINAQYGLRFHEPGEQGVTHYLAGLCSLNDIFYETNIPGMYITPVGRRVTNSLSLLNSPQLENLLDRMLEQLDYVIVDAPPVGIVIDAAEIAKSCDGTLFAVKYNEVRRKELAEAKMQIERTGCEILGAVLNEVSFKSYSSKKYYNKNYYNQYAYSYYTAANGKSPKPKKNIPAKVESGK